MIDLINKIDIEVIKRKSAGLTCTEIFISKEEKEQLVDYLNLNKSASAEIKNGDTVQKGRCTLFGMKVRCVDKEIHIR